MKKLTFILVTLLAISSFAKDPKDGRVSRRLRNSSSNMPHPNTQSSQPTIYGVDLETNFPHGSLDTTGRVTDCRESLGGGDESSDGIDKFGGI